MDWDDLRFALAVARAGSLTGAAQGLGVDHSTVGRRIDRLERALNAKLFDRMKTGYAATPAGERLLRTAEAVEAAVLAGEAEIGDENAAVSGAVRIGAPDGFGTYFLAPHIAALCDAHPRLEVELVATARLFSLSKREADVAIALSLPAQGRVVGRKLTDYHLGLYATADYLARHGLPRAATDLARHRLVGYIDELLYTPELDYLHLICPEAAPRFRSANLIAQVQAVRAGLGIGVLPAFIAQTDPALKPVLAAEISLVRTFYLLIHADSQRLARIRATVGFIHDLAQRHRRLFDPHGG
ncbi:LysR family transcriptional regulator [Oleisolibacter albus]|uniref:LysR family transcriptional regulator n=1 Tax=Oleisolibacter albus TaxID=2171757 RepID=UPI000DF2B92F|nr:LysR family transcriptional regulator [Oleisolibacter albus]